MTKDLIKKEKELKARFDVVKNEAMDEEKIIVEHQKIYQAKVDELKDLQAQYRLVQELRKK